MVMYQKETDAYYGTAILAAYRVTLAEDLQVRVPIASPGSESCTRARSRVRAAVLLNAVRALISPKLVSVQLPSER
jgi:hypothetical protein